MGIIVSGPIQILDEALDTIRVLRAYNMKLEGEKARQRVRQFTEELMQKVWHPKRVMAWIESGFDASL